MSAGPSRLSRRRAVLRSLSVALPALLCGEPSVLAHHAPRHGSQSPAVPAVTTDATAQGVSGQGALRFRVLLTSAHLPEAARKVLASAHGGFAVDHRPGKEETYFALPGAGILRMAADLKQVA